MSDKVIKTELLALIEWATSQLNEIEIKPEPVKRGNPKTIKGKHVSAYYCDSEPITKYRIEVGGRFVKWLETREQALDCINKFEQK